jgi:hypothetical protein
VKRTVILAAVMLGLFTTIVGAGRPASAATTCYTGGGGSETWAIKRCGTASVSAVFNGPCVFGHWETWDYYHTNLWRNEPEDGSWCGGDAWAMSPAPWDDRTCVEFWQKVGSKFVRFGTIDCTSH